MQTNTKSPFPKSEFSLKRPFLISFVYRLYVYLPQMLSFWWFSCLCSLKCLLDQVRRLNVTTPVRVWVFILNRKGPLMAMSNTQAYWISWVGNRCEAHLTPCSLYLSGNIWKIFFWCILRKIASSCNNFCYFVPFTKKQCIKI